VLLVSDSIAYKEGVAFIRGSEDIQESVGTILEIRLAFFARTAINISTHRGAARYTVVVIGKQRTEKLSLKMEMFGEEWRVTSITSPSRVLEVQN
jgi:hypothetical protein